MPTSGLSNAAASPLIIVTDLEPDDRIALLLVAAEVPAADIAFIGTTVMHAGRKRLLVRQLLDQLGLNEVAVIQGSGGDADDYPDIASSSAARHYSGEGLGLLNDTQLAEADNSPRSSDALSHAIREQLRAHPGTEILLLASPTDLVKALGAEPALAAHIGHIHVMGGWSKRVSADGSVRRHTTYNWNMDPPAAARLMAMRDVPMTLYSSDLIKSNFAGGSINADNSPEILATLQALRAGQPAVAAFFVAGKSWDQHLMEQIPALRNIIGDQAGRQFTPADPMVVVGMTTPGLIQAKRPVAITIDLAELDPALGYAVTVRVDARSKIQLVDAIDTGLFRRRVTTVLQGGLTK